MIFWLEIFGVLAVLAGLGVLYFQIIRPFYQLRESLRRLAERDFRPVLLQARRGKFRESAGHVRKISELLQQLDQQIMDEGFSLRAILSSMVEGVLIADRSQRIRLVNETLHNIFQLTQSPINRTVMEVFRNHELQQAIERTLFDGEARKIEILLRQPEGSTYGARSLDVYVGGLNPKPHVRPLGAVLVFHDVTAVKNLEAVRRDFVANISHEFRTPLAIINGYIETLLDGALDDRPMAEKSLRIMHKNGQRLALLIQDLLTISRLEHRYPQLEFQTIKLPAILARVIERLELAIRERGARIQEEWGEDVLLECDPRKIEQVFANLMENALRHGPAEGAVVRVSSRKVGKEIEVVFSDNGPGIPYDDQPHIFERFYRVHKDRSRSAGGTGLGLSIVKHIVQAHGGSVSLESVPGQGASFKVRLPLSHPASANPMMTDHAA